MREVADALGVDSLPPLPTSPAKHALAHTGVSQRLGEALGHDRLLRATLVAGGLGNGEFEDWYRQGRLVLTRWEDKHGTSVERLRKAAANER